MKKLLTILALVSTAQASTITTPDMGLLLPVPGTEPGPQWAQDLNAALEAVDSHDHTPGNGAQVPTAGININADLQLGNYNLVNPRSTMFTNQSAPLATSADKNNVYVSGGNLYFNNSSGTAIQITTGNTVNTSSAGNISGIGGTGAALTYSNILKSFTFTQSSGVTADLAGGSINIYEDVASANPITLKSPHSLAIAYTLTFPGSIPGSGAKLLTVDSTGQIGDTYDVDNSTLQIVSSLLQIKDQGVGTAKITDGSVTQVKMASRSTGTSVGVGGVAIASSSGNFTRSPNIGFATVTNQSVTITTTGRPVMVFLQSDRNSSFGQEAYVAAGGNTAAIFQLVRDTSTVIANYKISADSSFSAYTPASSVSSVDIVGSGTHTYTFQIEGSGSNSVTANNVTLVAYEL